MSKGKRVLGLVVALSLVLFALYGVAFATKVIKVGAVYPLTGDIAPTGKLCKEGVELAVDIINGKYDLDLIMARTEGIPSLGGAKIKIIFADSQGSPRTGMAEAERLITSEHVVAMVGGYQSAVVKTASYAAERLKIPYVLSDATSPALTRRGFKYFFRVNPDDVISARNFFEFVQDMEKKFNRKLRRVALLYENTEWGSKVAAQQRKWAKEFGFKIVADIPYYHGATDVTSEVLKLKSSKPDILMHAPYVSDAILFTKTFKKLNFNVPLWMGMSGYLDPNYIKSVGKDGEYVVVRSTFNPDLARIKPLIGKVNELYKKKYGRDMSGIAARSFNAPLVLADAINRAGSLDPDAIRKVLLETDIPGDKILMAWKGVKFNKIHQNIYARYILVQIQGGKYHTVWPWNVASTKVVFPVPAWNKR